MLTKREEQVLELTAWGASAKEVAQFLHVSTVTIQNHIHNIKDKLKLQKATEISAWFFCNTFHISMDLSPIRRQIIGLSMIFLIAFETFNFSGHELRGKRIRIVSRKGKTELLDEL
jgi:DNA-binding CsgD family transcriptional regulator